MSGDILDLIDGAIDAWETSVDAMRWAPDPAAAESPYVAALERMYRDYLAALDPPVELTPWQREVLRAALADRRAQIRIRLDRPRLPDLPPSLRAEYRQRAARLFDVPPELLR